MLLCVNDVGLFFFFRLTRTEVIVLCCCCLPLARQARGFKFYMETSGQVNLRTGRLVGRRRYERHLAFRAHSTTSTHEEGITDGGSGLLGIVLTKWPKFIIIALGCGEGPWETLETSRRLKGCVGTKET